MNGYYHTRVTNYFVIFKMYTTVLTLMAWAMTFTDDYLSVTATHVNLTTVTPEANQKSPKSIQLPYPEQRNTFQNTNSDDYDMYSSLISDAIMESSPSTAIDSKAYLSMTTNSPNFVTRSRFIRNPPFHARKVEQEMEFEEDLNPHLFYDRGSPKWNRFNINHRLLNNYGPTPIGSDITVKEDGSSRYYESTLDVGTGGRSGFESGTYRNPENGLSNGAGMVGWFSAPLSQPLRPVPIIAEIRQPGNRKMFIDLSKIGMLALIKIALAKLKALGFIKAKLLVLFKLKLLVLIVTVKFLMLVKFFKMSLIVPLLLSTYLVPMMLSRLLRLNMLLQQSGLIPNSMGSSILSDGETSGGGGDLVGEDGDAETFSNRAGFDPLDILDTGIEDMMRSENCVERKSCQIAGADRPSLKLIGLNWALLPFLEYIPNEKIRTFVSTFTKVINYRIDNIHNSVLPSNWTKWCDDRYDCPTRYKTELSR